MAISAFASDFKQCTGCLQIKHCSNFSFHTRATGQLMPKCKPCKKEEYGKYWASLSQEQRYMRQRTAMIRYRYGMEPEEYDSMLASQGGVCAICGDSQPGRGKDKFFHVDHNHETGRVRGLLCNQCNTGLGKFKEDKELLDKAKAYLAGDDLSQ